MTDLNTHLRALEASLLDPVVRRDRAQVSSLLDEEFFEFGSSGRTWSRQETLDLLATEDFIPLTMEDFDCHLLAEDVALITYRSVRIHPETGTPSAALRSSIWVCADGAWRIRFHQGTRVC